MGAAVNPAVPFNAVTDHFAAALRATRCERVNRAFEAVKDMGLALSLYFEALVVIVPADFTFRHSPPSPVRRSLKQTVSCVARPKSTVEVRPAFGRGDGPPRVRHSPQAWMREVNSGS